MSCLSWGFKQIYKITCYTHTTPAPPFQFWNHFIYFHEIYYGILPLEATLNLQLFQFFTLTLQCTWLWGEGDNSYGGPDTKHGYLPKLWSLFTLNAFIHVKEQKFDDVKFIFDRENYEINLELEIKKYLET